MGDFFPGYLQVFKAPVVYDQGEGTLNAISFSGAKEGTQAFIHAWQVLGH